MTELRFPGPSALALPALTLELPDGWEPITVPGALVAARATTAEHFAANVVVSIARHSRSFTVHDAAAVLDRELAALPQATLLEPEQLGALDGRAYVRMVAFAEEPFGSLVQIHLLVTVPRPASVDLVGIVGTCSGDRVDKDQPVLVAILDSLQISGCSSL